MRWTPLKTGIVLAACLFSHCAHSGPAADASWRVIETEHVRLRTDLWGRLAPKAARRLERHLQLVQDNTFPCAEGRLRRRVEVTLLRRESDFRAIAPTGAEAAFVASDPGITAVRPQILMHGDVSGPGLHMFQHELTHHLVHLCHASAPPWLHEGLAEYVATATYARDELVIGIPKYMAWTKAVVRQAEVQGAPVTWVPRSRLPRPSELVHMDAEAFYVRSQQGAKRDEQVRYHYAAAAILVHVLESSEGALQKRYQRYLRALAAGTKDGVAFRRAFAGFDLDGAFDRALDLGSRSTFYVKTSLPSVRGVRERTMPRADIHAHLAALWGWSDGPARARAAQHVELGLAMVPAHSGLRQMRIQLALAAGDLAAARRALAQWREHAPNDSETLRTAVRMNLDLPDGDPNHASRDLAALRETEHFGQSASDLALAARCALADGNQPAAHAYVERALARDPLCARCHLAQALVLLAAQDFSEADAAAARAARLAGEDSPWAWEVASQIRQQIASARSGKRSQSSVSAQTSPGDGS